MLDLDSLKTGWQKSEGIQGVAPEWKWNASVNQMMQKPGDDYKKGMSVKVALGKDKAVIWEQAGAAVWQVLTNLSGQLKDAPAGKLPHVKMTGSKDIKFQKGSTAYPEFEIVKWVDRPDCLKEGVAAGIALDETPPAAKEPAPHLSWMTTTTLHKKKSPAVWIAGEVQQGEKNEHGNGKQNANGSQVRNH